MPTTVPHVLIEELQNEKPKRFGRWIILSYWTLQLWLTLAVSLEFFQTPAKTKQESEVAARANLLWSMVSSPVASVFMYYYAIRKTPNFRCPNHMLTFKVCYLIGALSTGHFISKLTFKSGNELVTVLALSAADFGLILLDIWCESDSNSGLKQKAMLYGFMQLTLTISSVQELLQRDDSTKHSIFLMTLGFAFVIGVWYGLKYRKHRGHAFKCNKTLLLSKIVFVPTTILTEYFLHDAKNRRNFFKSGYSLINPLVLMICDLLLIGLEWYCDKKEDDDSVV
jgi:hypothetical protein